MPGPERYDPSTGKTHLPYEPYDWGGILQQLMQYLPSAGVPSAFAGNVASAASSVPKWTPRSAYASPGAPPTSFRQMSLAEEPSQQPVSEVPLQYAPDPDKPRTVAGPRDTYSGPAAGRTSTGGTAVPPNTSITNASGTEGTDPNIARQNARYDSSDMGKSFRNAYRDAGYAYDPWNKDIKNTVSRFGAAALPQYLSSLAGGANYGDSAGGSLQNFLTQYIQGILGGGGGIMPWSMGQAQQGMGQLAGLAETARNQYTQSGGDYSKVNLGNPLLNALANLFMDEDTVSSMNASAYAPSMDSSLLSSLIDHIGNAQQYYGDVTRPGQIGKKPGELAPTWATILQQQLGGR